MKTIDPRIAHRRRQVAEDHARTSARRVLRLLLLLAVIGVCIWVARSPWFSVAEIRIEGAQRADVERILDEVGVRLERPLIMVPARRGEAALLDDPWIADASISKVFPDLVEVAVIERAPVAIVSARGQEVVVASDGTVLAPHVDRELPLIRVSEPVPDPGGTLEDRATLGAVEFIAALHVKYLPGTSVSLVDTELWAKVGEFDVRLGRPVDMAEKARSLAAVLDAGQEPGALINVIAPARPTVLPSGANPQPEQEG